MARAEYILGIDYGEKRVGLAIAHQVARLPRPLTTLENSSELLDNVKEIIAAEGVGQVVVGVPLGLDGGRTPQTETVAAFEAALRAALGGAIPVYTTEETLSSVEAEAALAGKHHAKGDIDALAASYILERFLEQHQEATA